MNKPSTSQFVNIDEIDDIARGERLLISGVMYAVSHINVNGKRGDINLIALDEARVRRDALNELLEDN